MDTPIGAATGTFFSDPDGPFLVVAYRQITVSITLTRGDLSADQSRSVAVDLAQRVLPVLVPRGVLTGGSGVHARPRRRASGAPPRVRFICVR